MFTNERINWIKFLFKKVKLISMKYKTVFGYQDEKFMLQFLSPYAFISCYLYAMLAEIVDGDNRHMKSSRKCYLYSAGITINGHIYLPV